MAGRTPRRNDEPPKARTSRIRTVGSWALVLQSQRVRASYIRQAASRVLVLLILALALWGCVAIVRGTGDDSPTGPSPVEDSPAPQRPSQMPGVVCDNLATADSVLTNRGIYAEYQDATSEDRVPFDYANWIVVAQNPGPGEAPGDDPVLAVVKLGETSDC